MNITELIEKLSQYDPDTRVVVKGPESGFNDIKLTKELTLVLNVNPDWWDGRHEELCIMDILSPAHQGQIEQAILIF